MRTCATLLQVVGFLFGILGVIGGIITATTQTYTYDPNAGLYGSTVSSPPNSTEGIAIIASSIVLWLTLYGFSMVLEALANIQDDSKQSAEANNRSALANERAAEALERLVYQRRRKQAQENDAAVAEVLNQPMPPPASPPASPSRRNTVLRQLSEKDQKT